MNALVLYDSKFGNTERIARTVAARLEGAWAVRLAAAADGAPDLVGVDLLVVGGPTQVHGVSPTLGKLLDGIPRGALRGVSAAAFDTRLPRSRLVTGSAAVKIARRLKRSGARLLAPPESFLVTGGEGPLVEGELEHAGRWAAGLLVEVRGPAVAA